MAGQTDFSISRMKSFADKIEAKLGEPALERLIKLTTAEAQEAVVEQIGDVYPHSGQGRVIPREVVTDLVDTGNLRGSFRISFPGRFHGRVATNVEYARPLEEGSRFIEEGFAFVENSARKMKRKFVKNVRSALAMRGNT